MYIYTHIYVHVYTYIYMCVCVYIYVCDVHTHITDVRQNCRALTKVEEGPCQPPWSPAAAPRHLSRAPSSRRGGTQCVWMAVKVPRAYLWVTHDFPLLAALAHSEQRRGPLLLSPSGSTVRTIFLSWVLRSLQQAQHILVLWLLAEEGTGFLL